MAQQVPMYRRIAQTWRKLWSDRPPEIKSRAITWRRGATITRLERPSRLDRARSLGYKSKQGFVILRVKVAKGGMRRKRPRSGRRPKHLGVVKIKAAVGMQEVAEKRAAKRFPNLYPLNSYYIFDDGRSFWYEVILVDPHHPAIVNDKDLRWLVNKTK